MTPTEALSSLDILNAVNHFYDQSFNRLLAITFGLLALIGVIVPLAVGWVQMRTLKAEKSSLYSDLRSDLLEERAALEGKITEEVQRRLQEFKAQQDLRFEETTSEVKKSLASAKARAHHLQANSLMSEQTAGFGIPDFCHAAGLYFIAEEESNAQRCVKAVIESCLPKCDSASYLKNRVNESCKELTDTLQSNNANHRYSDILTELEDEIASVLERKLD